LTARLADLGVPKLDRLSVGVGMISLYGFGLRFPDNSPLATSVITAALPLLDLKPTIAYRVTDILSIGLGADIFTFASFVGQGHLEQQLRWPGGLGLLAGSRVEVNGTGTTAGLNASMLYTPFLTRVVCRD
jgi:long-chain fatty acid transport protein